MFSPKHNPERNIRKFGNSITLAAFQGKPFHAGFDCLVCGSLTYEIDFRKLTFTLESVAAELGALFQTENSFHSAVGGVFTDFVPNCAVKSAHVNALQYSRVEVGHSVHRLSAKRGEVSQAETRYFFLFSNHSFSFH